MLLWISKINASCYLQINCMSYVTSRYSIILNTCLNFNIVKSIYGYCQYIRIGLLQSWNIRDDNLALHFYDIVIVNKFAFLCFKGYDQRWLVVYQLC